MKRVILAVTGVVILVTTAYAAVPKSSAEAVLCQLPVLVSPAQAAERNSTVAQSRKRCCITGEKPCNEAC